MERNFAFLKMMKVKKLLCEEIDKLGIPVYSFHTNFDAGEGGMNDALCEALHLEDVYTLYSIQ